MLRDDWQEYRVLVTARAAKGLKSLKKRPDVLRQLRTAIEDLRNDPEGQTQPLAGELSQFRSLHVGRCRVVVKIDRTTVVVYVVAAGWHTSGARADVYALLKRDIKHGHIDPDQPNR